MRRSSPSLGQQRHSSPPKDELAHSKQRNVTQLVKTKGDAMIKRANPVVCSHCIDTYDRAPTDTRAPRRVEAVRGEDGTLKTMTSKKPQQPRRRWSAAEGHISTHESTKSATPRKNERPQSAKVVGSPRGHRPNGRQRPQTASASRGGSGIQQPTPPMSSAGGSRSSTPRLMKGFTRWEMGNRGVCVVPAPSLLAQQQHVSKLVATQGAFQEDKIVQQSLTTSPRPQSVSEKPKRSSSRAAAVAEDEALGITHDDGDDNNGVDLDHEFVARLYDGVRGHSMTPTVPTALFQHDPPSNRPLSARVVPNRPTQTPRGSQRRPNTARARCDSPSKKDGSSTAKETHATTNNGPVTRDDNEGPLRRNSVHESRGLAFVAPTLTDDPPLHRNWRPSPRNDEEMEAAVKRADHCREAAPSACSVHKAANRNGGESPERKPSPPKHRTPTPHHGDATSSERGNATSRQQKRTDASSISERVLRLHRHHVAQRLASNRTKAFKCTTRRHEILTDGIQYRCSGDVLYNTKESPHARGVPMGTYGPTPRALRKPVARAPDTVIL